MKNKLDVDELSLLQEKMINIFLRETKTVSKFNHPPQKKVREEVLAVFDWESVGFDLPTWFVQV